ncbi:T9SS type A sorting domain-containing protein [Reichenbachiella sp.]|uniref:T9SS-dependent choice-of-anchor J family protein n=1 Tax=Reichenbachiella sp. TaxID=2184521 RepID=UPI003298EB3C
MKNKNFYVRKLALTVLSCFLFLYASAQYTIPVSVHIARTSNGGSPRATTSQVDAEIATLNSAYSSMGITFVKCGQNFIDEDRLWDQFDDGDQTEKDWLDNFTDPNVVNYFITDLEGGGHGKAVFPYKQKDWLAVDYDEMGTSTVAHEMGHYLNLHHTYSGVDGDDPASSSSLTIADAEGSNGWKYGDYLIDTPLDPEERDDFNSSCVYTGNQKDANGASFHPDGRNFMGKGHNYCRDRFSAGQEARILRSINIDRYYLDCNDSGNTNLTCANSSSVSSFPHNDSFNGGYANSPWVQARYGDELNWEIAPNTDSNSTGPNSAQNGQTFMHAEASFTYTSSDDLSLLSPCYDLSGKTTAEVEFYYHMYGSGTGTLRLEVSTNNGSSWSSLFSKSGQQHSSGSSSWTQQVVNLDSYVGQSIQLRLRATLGTSSKSDIAIDNVTVDASGSGGGSTTVLSESYFESGWDDWNDLNTGSTDCERKTNTSFAAEGNDAIRIKDNSGTNSTMESDAFDVSAYYNLEIEFKVIGDDHESSSETFSVLYYDGSVWHNEATYNYNSDYFNGSVRTKTVSISSSQRNFPSNAKFRIESDGSSSNGDYTYIDAVIIRGSTGSQARTHDSGAGLENNSLEFPQNVSKVNLYPNPASHFMKITSIGQVMSAQVYDINGAVHKGIAFDSKESTVDISSLSKGIYVILITTDKGEAYTRKFIRD